MSFDPDAMIDPDLMISGVLAPATSEVDISICPTNLCKIVAAANNATSSLQRIFFLKTGTWQQVNIPPVHGDSIYNHPSLGWTTSDERVWVVNVSTNIGVSTSLRCFFSDDAGETWTLDEDFGADPLTGGRPIRSPRLEVDKSEHYLRDTIYVIWGTVDSGLNKVFLKSRNPHNGAWRPTIVLDDQSAGDVSGCDIKSDPATGEFTVTGFWHDRGSGQLIARSSKAHPEDPEAGPEFGPRSTIATATAGTGISIPSCAINKAAISVSSACWGAILHFVWADLAEDGTGKTRVWYSRANSSFGNIGYVTEKKRITADDSLHDQFHPRIFMDLYTNTLVVVYYDTIGDPTRQQTGVFMQTSEDRGENWSSPKPLTTAPSDETTAGANSFQYGDYLGLTGATLPGVLFAAWTDRRSGLPEQIWASRIRIPPPIEPCSSDPILNGATITFHTTNEDKDHNTTIDIKLDGQHYWVTAEDAAVASGDYGHFDDGSSHQVPLHITKFLVTRRSLRRGQVHITITPHGGLGQDTWKFTFSLDLKFTNGDPMHLEYPTEIKLENSDTESIPLSSMIGI